MRVEGDSGALERKPSGTQLRMGKLPPGLLNRLLESYTSTDDPRIGVPARIGMDATVIDFGKTYLVAKTDPITFVTEEIGTYAINVNANDIACMGGEPKWFLASILLPVGSADEGVVVRTFEQISRECKRYGISYCGGHTEVTGAVRHVTVIGCMLGEVSKDRLVSAAGAAVGDAILLTKGIAIEATSIIAREKHAELVALFSAEFADRCKKFLRDPGISVLKDARAALEAGTVHALHDPTEGGLAAGLQELASASGVGVRIDYDRIPILPESKLLCDEFGLDPLGAIASGALLIAAPKRDVDAICRSSEAAGIPCAVIGTVTERDSGCLLQLDGETRPLPIFESDEITRLFS